MFLNQFLNPVNLGTVEPLVALKPDWLKPKLSFIVIPLNMDVGWLIPIACIAEESIGANRQQRRHSQLAT